MAGCRVEGEYAENQGNDQKQTNQRIVFILLQWVWASDAIVSSNIGIYAFDRFENSRPPIFFFQGRHHYLVLNSSADGIR